MIFEKSKSEFTRNVLTLMTGTTISQAIPLAISPILTRIYTPEDFGLFSLYLAIFSILCVFATGKYELAIILPKKNSDAMNIVALSIMISTLISLLLLIIILLFNREITNLIGSPEISKWLYFIPFSVFFVGVYQSFNYWSNRNKNYSLISKSIIFQSASNSTGNLSFGLSGFSSFGLIITNFITSIISAFYLITKNKEDILQYKKDIKIVKIISLLKKYKKFPQHTLPQNIIYSFTLQMPIFFIKAMFSLNVLGAFSLAYRVIVTPVSIISNSFGQVFYQKASTLYNLNKEELYFYTRKMFFSLLLLSFSIGSLLVFFLPDIFTVIFGEKWTQAGVIGQFLIIYLTFDFALSPLTKLYFIFNHNSFYLKWEIFRFFTFLIFFIIFYFLNILNVNYFFLFFSLINLFMYVIIAFPILYKKSFLWRNCT